MQIAEGLLLILIDWIVAYLGLIKSYLLWRNIKGDCSHINRVEIVDAGNNKE